MRNRRNYRNSSSQVCPVCGQMHAPGMCMGSGMMPAGTEMPGMMPGMSGMVGGAMMPGMMPGMPSMPGMVGGAMMPGMMPGMNMPGMMPGMNMPGCMPEMPGMVGGVTTTDCCAQVEALAQRVAALEDTVKMHEEMMMNHMKEGMCKPLPTPFNK